MLVDILSAQAAYYIYLHKDKPGIIIPVGKHGAKEVPKGTEIKILKTAGLKK